MHIKMIKYMYVYIYSYVDWLVYMKSFEASSVGCKVSDHFGIPNKYKLRNE